MNERRRKTMRKRSLVIGAAVAVAASVGTGFVVQSSVAAQRDSIAQTAALSATTEMRGAQLGAYSNVLAAHAERDATSAVAAGKKAIAAAEGKADAKKLSTLVGQLSKHAELEADRTLELVAQTKTETKKVTDAVAAFDRAAAEKKAAEEAAAKKAAEEAAAKAAAEQAAAEEAAAEEAAQQSASYPSAPTDPGGAQAIARDMMAASYGWGEDQFGCLVALWDKESGWNVNAYNASSGATGIPQALPGSKMASAGADWATNPATQIAWGLGYIADRYGSPCAAWDHSSATGWY